MFAPGTLEAFGLYLVRTSALVLASPILGSSAGFAGYKIGVIGTLSLLLYSVSGEPFPHASPPVEYGLFVLREVLVGVFLAFVLQSVLVAVRVAGDLVGNEMGFNMAAIVDPASGIRTPLISRTYEVLFFLGILGLNGHHWLLRALAESFERAPVGRLPEGGGMLSVVLAVFGELFAAGITFAAPIMILLALVSLLLGLLTRTVPHLNVLEFGFSVRIVAALVAMCLFAPLINPTLERFLAFLVDGLAASLDELGI